MLLSTLDLTTIGAASIAALAIITAVFTFLKPIVMRRIEEPKTQPKEVKELEDSKIERMASQIDRLSKQHDAVDEDGAPLWYFPRSHERAMGKLCDTMERFRVEQGIKAQKQIDLLEQLLKQHE